MSEQKTHELDFEQACNDVIYLCKCAVNGVAADREAVGAMDLDAVFELACAHRLASAVAMGLESAGCEDKRVAVAIVAAQRKDIIFAHAQAEVTKALEEAGIWYALLKGAVLKGLYPKFGMREFADCDILFDAARAEDVRAIMEGLAFSTEDYGHGDHDIYYRQPVLNFEMHRSLFDPASHDAALCAYYENVEARLVGEGFGKRFSNEDFYLYILAHEHKHYVAAGTGLRSVLDTYVYLSAVELDMAYVAAEAEKLGLREFEEKNRSLALHVFGGGELAGDEAEMLAYIMSSGAYGTMAHYVSSEIRKGGGSKLRYVLKRLSVPVSRKNKRYDMFAEQYPFFYEHKALLPVLPFYRVVQKLGEGKVLHEVRLVRDSKGEGFPE